MGGVCHLGAKTWVRLGPSLRSSLPGRHLVNSVAGALAVSLGSDTSPASTWRGGWCYDFGMIVFDELAKILAARMERRNALKLAGKAITGGVLASLAVGQTHAKTCKDGTMRCHGQGFDTCEHGKWVFSKCAPGTTCVQNGLTILCEPRPEYQPDHD